MSRREYARACWHSSSPSQRGLAWYDRDMARKKNPAAVALGRLGGKKGGKARMAQLTAEQKSKLGREAARARWGKRR
jgi:hypothetical protein